MDMPLPPSRSEKTTTPDTKPGLTGRSVLIVEDEYFLADDLANNIRDAGFNIIGPASSLAEANELVVQQSVHLAVLDIALGNEVIYDLADALIDRGVPILFVTGYDRIAVPNRYADVPMFQKPIHVESMIAGLERLTTK